MSGYILALDQGTTSSRALLFDPAGRTVATAQQEFRQHYPHPGWVEHDPHDIWRSQFQVAQAVLAQARVEPGAVAALGITNQRETVLLWERASGKPLHRAIVWQCRRTADHCEQLKAAGHHHEIKALTGLVTDAYFSATKLAWLLEHVPGARQRAEAGELAFGTVDSWLIWQLTEGREHVTDVSNAARTLLFNIDRGDWDDALLARFKIPRALLPRVVPSSGVLGETRLFGAPLPIAGVAGDQQAATFGQACITPGLAKNTYGTGCFAVMNTGERRVDSEQGLLTTIGWQLEPGARLTYALEGGVFIAGAAVQWLRDELGIIASAAEIEPLAAQVADSHGVFFVPAFVGLGTPHWDPYARGAILGLTRGANKHHLARATLEAIALQSAEVVEAMTQAAGLTATALRVDGGASRNDLLMQIQADLLGLPVERPHNTETTALGAAFLAGLAVGQWRLPELAAMNPVARRFEPAWSEDRRRGMLEQWRRAVTRARDWARE
jgi:glycerol kinase